MPGWTNICINGASNTDQDIGSDSNKNACSDEKNCIIIDFGIETMAI